MTSQIHHPLPPESLRTTFIKQLSILYMAKSHIIDCLPAFIKQATFQNLKLALAEDLEDTITQMEALRQIFIKLNQSAVTEDCLAMRSLIKEAEQQVFYAVDDYYSSDMSIIFYMNVIEHMQVGACRVLEVLTKKEAFKSYLQLVKESLDMNKDNARLFQVIGKEYLGL